MTSQLPVTQFCNLFTAKPQELCNSSPTAEISKYDRNEEQLLVILCRSSHLKKVISSPPGLKTNNDNGNIATPNPAEDPSGIRKLKKQWAVQWKQEEPDSTTVGINNKNEGLPPTVELKEEVPDDTEEFQQSKNENFTRIVDWKEEVPANTEDFQNSKNENFTRIVEWIPEVPDTTEDFQKSKNKVELKQKSSDETKEIKIKNEDLMLLPNERELALTEDVNRQLKRPRKATAEDPCKKALDDTMEKKRQRLQRFGSQTDTLKSLNTSENVTLDEFIHLRGISYERTKNYSIEDALEKMEGNLEKICKNLHPDDARRILQKKKGSKFRPIIVDGSNVAYAYGAVFEKRKKFCPKGISICVKQLTARRGCKDIHVVVPEEKLHDNTLEDVHILRELKQQGLLVTSFSRLVDTGKWISSYDDRLILKLATKLDGIVISNDRFRDLWQENSDWRNTIKNKVISFRFLPGVDNEITFPEDPFGRYGPSLTDMLKF